MSFSLCPYCGQNPCDRGGATKDHVFVESLGGSVTVRACRECNSTIGHDIEGPLQRPASCRTCCRNPVERAWPFPGRWGVAALPVTNDFATHEIRSRQPVAVRREGGVQTFTVSGSPDQVRRALRRTKDRTSQVVMMCLRGGRTAVLVHLAGVVLGGAGFVVDALMPTGDGLWVVVCDRHGSLLIRFLSDEVTAALASGIL